MRSYLSEFLGTFLFLFLLTCVFSRFDGDILWTSITAGCGITLAVAVFGGISGAHCNPAISLAAFFEGSLSGYLLLPYWIAQFAGGIAAVFAASFLLPSDARLGAVVFTADLTLVFILECVIVLFLSLLHLVAVRSWRYLAPFLIGGAVCASFILLLPVTGAGLNPVRIIAPVVITAFPLAASQVWIFVFAAFLGGAVAGVLLRYCSR